MGWSVGFLTSSTRDRRHPRWMRRIALAFTTAGLLTLGGGYLALGAAGDEAAAPAAPRAATSPMVATPEKTAEAVVSLPPLPQTSRARSVAPVAGQAGSTADAAAAADPGLSTVDAKPTKEASAAVRGKNPARGGSNAVDKAVALGNGVALPPLEAPAAIKKMIEAGNGIARTPYMWGGGHGKWQDTGYDCSGSVSFVLAAAGYLNSPLASGSADVVGRARQGQG